MYDQKFLEEGYLVFALELQSSLCDLSLYYPDKEVWEGMATPLEVRIAKRLLWDRGKS